MEKKLAIHRNISKYSNMIELIDNILSIYSIIKFKDSKRLRNYEKNVLIYYVINGISEETLDNVCKDKSIEKNYLHKINKDLRDKGYLVSSSTNYRKFSLNSELEDIRENFINQKFKDYWIRFTKNDEKE